MRLRLLTSLSLLVLALALGACGTKGGATNLASGSGEETVQEGFYADIGGLKYQVQLSRELNPTDIEDRSYLIGAPARGLDISPKETWFGVWMRVQYDRKSGRPLPTAREFVMEDTQGNQWRPVALGADNVFAYRPLTLAPTKILPDPSSASGEDTIQGALLLFRVPFENLQNRPLVLKVTDPTQPGRVTDMGLDV